MFTEEQQSAIEKVRKILNLSEGNTSEEEAQTAMLMARRILAKYNLNITDIPAYTQKTECDEKGAILRTKVMPKWVSALACAMNKMYECKSIMCTSESGRIKLGFIGVEPNLSICLHAFIYLYRYLDDIDTIYSSTSDKNSYRIGFVMGLLEKYKEEKAQEVQCTALVVAQGKLIDQYLDKTYPHHKMGRATKTHVNTLAYNQGRVDGKAFHYQKAIAG